MYFMHAGACGVISESKTTKRRSRKQVAD